jgi:ribosomal protein S1
MYKGASRYAQHRAMQHGHGRQAGHRRRAQPKQRVPKSIRRAFARQQPIQGTIAGFNKGGSEVLIDGTRAFCPYSLMYPVVASPANRDNLIGQSVEAMIVEITSRSLVVSQRAVCANAAWSES